MLGTSNNNGFKTISTGLQGVNRAKNNRQIGLLFPTWAPLQFAQNITTNIATGAYVFKTYFAKVVENQR